LRIASYKASLAATRVGKEISTRPGFASFTVVKRFPFELWISFSVY